MSRIEGVVTKIGDNTAAIAVYEAGTSAMMQGHLSDSDKRALDASWKGASPAERERAREDLQELFEAMREEADTGGFNMYGAALVESIAAEIRAVIGAAD